MIKICKRIHKSVELSILFVVLIFSGRCFFALAKRWFPDEANSDGAEDNVHQRGLILRRSLLKSFLFNGVIFFFAILFLFLYLNITFNKFNVLKTIAFFIVLTATIGRGGWSIQSSCGNTLVERMDKGFFKISQYINAVIFLVAMYWPQK